jgi:beta-glucosidase
VRRRLIATLLVLGFMAACGEAPTQAPDAAPSSGPANGSAATLDERVTAYLDAMTLQEKIGQMTQVEKNSILPGDITRYFIGSVLSGGGGYPMPNTGSAWVGMVRGFQEEALATRLGIPLLYGTDGVHGHANLHGATVFPQAVGLGATGDPELVRQIARATAEELAATGVRWNFAPVIAVPQDVRWGRTYESFGEETDLVGVLGSAFVEGTQSLPDGAAPAPGQTLYVLATPKHFLGDGGTTFGTSTQFIFEPYLLDQGDMRLDESAVRALFLPPYQQAIAEGARSVMVSFSSWNGIKMHAQAYWITDVLKDELAFDGFVVSDWGGMDQISEDYDEAIVTGINAGIDMNMVPYDYERFIATMTSAVEQGDISMERIDDAVRRILRVKFELGLFDQPPADEQQLDGVASDEHRELARQAVRQSLVLLTDAAGMLPLSKQISTIYVAGLGADDMGMQCGGWTIEWQGALGDIQPGTTLLEAIEGAVSPATVVTYDPQGEFQGMADVGIAVIGERPYAEGVGDEAALNLPEADIRALTNLRDHSRQVVAILITGRPLVITDQLGLADAWIVAWLPGTEGGGVADVLFGDAPFTGSLPYTWPRTNDQLPINIATSEGLTGCDAPLLPFGFAWTEAAALPARWPACP